MSVLWKRNGGKVTSAAYVAFTDADYERLTNIAALYASPYSQLLKEELARGKVLDRRAVPKSLVTMNSRVRFMDLFSGSVRRVTLVYPTDADPEQGKISVLSPLGIALIGLSAGQAIYWRQPAAPRIQIRVLKVELQPPWG